MHIIEKIRNNINRLIETLSVFMLSAMVIVITYQVATRIIVNATPTWAEALSLFLFLWVGFFGIAYGFKEKTHISVEVFYHYFPGKIKRIVEFINALLVIAVGILFLIYGYDFAMGSMGSNLPGLNIPTGIRYLILPIVGLVMIFYGITNMIEKEKTAGGEVSLKKGGQ